MTGNRLKRFWLPGVVVAVVAAGALVLGTTTSSLGASGKTHAGSGTLIYGVIGNTNDKVWPYVPASSTSAGMMRYELYSTLTDHLRNGTLVMSLASKFVPSNGARDWDIYLKKNIKFSDGSPFTAKDVVFSFQQMFSKQHPANQPSVLTMVNPKQVTAKSTYVVHMHLKRQFAPLPELLAYSSFPMMSAKSTYQHPIGTGPFMLQSFTPARQAVMVANPYYFGQKPEFETLKAIYFDTDDAILNAFLSGQIDVTTIDGPDIPQVKASSGKSILRGSSGNYTMIEMRTDVKPFSDIRVREAFSLLINRKQVVENGYLGNATIGNDYIAASDSCGKPPFPQIQQNLQKAKQLLAQAGVPNLNVSLHTDGAFPGMMQTAQILAQNASQIGVKINIVRLSTAAFLNKWGKWPLYLNVNDPPFVVAVFDHFAPGAVDNATHFVNPKMSVLLKDLETKPGAAAQCNTIMKIHKLVHDLHIEGIPAIPEGLTAYDSKVHGLLPDALLGRSSYMFGGVSVSS